MSSSVKKKTIIDVAFSPLNNEIDFNQKCISLVDQWHSEKKPKGPNNGVINDLAENNRFTRGDVDKAFNKLHLINKPSYEVIDRIIKHFYILTYNKKTKTYTVKGKR